MSGGSTKDCPDNDPHRLERGTGRNADHEQEARKGVLLEHDLADASERREDRNRNAGWWAGGSGGAHEGITPGVKSISQPNPWTIPESHEGNTTGRVLRDD